MNDEEFWSFHILKLENRMGDQIIQTVYRIGCAQKLVTLSLICKTFNSLRKVLLNPAECIKI